MNDAVIFPRLLQTLSLSPLWSWDAPPTLWASLSDEEPVVLTPAIMVQSIEQLHEVAEHWRSHMPDNAVPVDTLCLTAEGEGITASGEPIEFRDAIVMHKDGGMSMFRHVKGELGVTEIDPTEQSSDSVEAMREVGAASWR